MSNTIDQFKQAVRDVGWVPPDTITPEKWTRFTTGKKGSKNGWLIYHEDGDYAHGSFGDWASGQQGAWSSVDKATLSPEQLARLQAAQVAARARADADQATQYREAVAQAKAIWDKAKPTTGHAYLTAKGINAHGARLIYATPARELCPTLSPSLTGPLLVIPMRRGNELYSLQFITEDGTKRPLTGGRKKGCYYAIGGAIQKRVIVCEGFATGASIFEATGDAVAVAFDRTNLKETVMLMMEKFKSAEIVVAGDDDWQTPGNPGLADATGAAKASGGRVVIPSFKGTKPPGADFNDLHQAEGLEAVRACFDAVQQPIDDDIDHHRNAPKPSPECLYGIVGEIASAGSDHTEANPYAVALSVLAYLGTALGRGPYFSIGDDWAHCNGFFLHIGRSARGRKGTAKKLIRRIGSRVKELSTHHAPQVHRGGLSSREGLAFLIHDGYREGKEDVPAIEDKRLLIVESEFANVLHQSKRDGNTLSSALRDAWDGGSIKPATKTSRLWASHPHISLMGDVTPSELLGLMNARELSNGFANRFLMIWAEGSKRLAFPKYTQPDVIDGFAQRILEVLAFVGADRHVERDTLRVSLSPEAASLYGKLYQGELNDRSAGDRIAGLLDRRAPVLLRLAMVFALTDKTAVIGVQHVSAAMAWIRYWTDSVKFVFQTAMDEVNVEQVSDTAEKIMVYLADKGQATRSELTIDCFGKHTSKSQIDQALDDLLTGTPPKITVETVPRKGGDPGRPSKIYKLAAKLAKLAKLEQKQQVTPDFDSCEVCEVIALDQCDSPASDIATGANFAKFSNFAETPNRLETRMDKQTSQSSLTSHGFSVSVQATTPESEEF